jgi:hypothetical protein
MNNDILRLLRAGQRHRVRGMRVAYRNPCCLGPGALDAPIIMLGTIRRAYRMVTVPGGRPEWFVDVTNDSHNYGPYSPSYGLTVGQVWPATGDEKIVHPGANTGEYSPKTDLAPLL